MDCEMNDAVDILQAPGGTRRRKYAFDDTECATLFQQAAKRQHIRGTEEPFPQAFHAVRLPLEDITYEAQVVGALSSEQSLYQCSSFSRPPLNTPTAQPQHLSPASGGGLHFSNAYRAEPVFGMSERNFAQENSVKCFPDKQQALDSDLDADCQLSLEERRQFEAARRATFSAEPGTSSAPVRLRFLSMLAEWKSVRKIHNIVPGSQKDKEMLRYVKLCVRLCEDRAWRAHFSQAEEQALTVTEPCQTLMLSECGRSNGYY
ncbi:hypothetical protein KFL_000290090 [Klebsormidium nitens]|uniref:Uncharacterized protein n=1 Tax=Klebsormidium nitens TaxID=105231 RepID=A0A1Y1HL71_KLENI|nr:hypothetical protein KFL_000290090 [Klebsormidium nitens]|eukprot:GAQ79360.1 hypothetical protein KFL_000290090 [Klebsormidium nitens]